jgi:chorismate mutase
MTDETDQAHQDSADNVRLTVQRERLDRIDQRLLDALRDRLACCVDIAYIKRRGAIPMMQPHRIGLVHARAAEYGREHGIDQDFLRRLYHLVIDETCRLEDVVMGAAAPADSASPTAEPAGY